MEPTMNGTSSRQQRGLELAATRSIRQKGGIWVVPSQVGTGTYNVHIMPKIASCTCPDFETRGVTCKHIFAVTYVMKREQHADGSETVTKTLTVTATTERTTYPQNWPAYNAAQTNEKSKFQSLLADLCSGIEEPQTRKMGRPSLPLSDAIFSATFKVYSTVSGRRFMTDLREAETNGFISKAPHYNSIFNYLENPELTSILHTLITQSSLPLRSVETGFAVDSSGFVTSRFVRWYDHKYGQVRQQHDWVKCHLMCGVKTNIVTAVEIHDRNANDSPLLPAMVETTARNFKMSEVSADKGYASKANADAVTKAGATPFIAFASHHRGNGGGTWEKMYHYFSFRRTEFLQHYHKRSNVESTFSMMKRKFGDGLRSKTDVAMVNETLCKVLCHNLVVLIHEMYELGIDPVFWTAAASA
jgi:transposase